MANKTTGKTMRVMIPHIKAITIDSTDRMVREALERHGKFGPARPTPPTDAERQAWFADEQPAGTTISCFEATLLSPDTITVNTRDRKFEYEATAPTTYEVEEGGHLHVVTPTTTATFHSAMWVSVELVTDGSVKQALNGTTA